MLAQGHYALTASFPPSYAAPLDDLGRAVGYQRTLFGDESLAVFTSALAALQPAFAQADAAWLAQWITGPASAMRERLHDEAARSEVLDLQGAREQAQGDEIGQLAASLDDLSDGFQGAEQFLTVSAAKVGRKGASQVDWVGLMGDRKVFDPETGQTVTLGSGTVITDYLRRAKTILTLLGVAEKGVSGPPEGATEHIERFKLIAESVVGLAGLACEVWAFALESRAVYEADEAAKAMYSGMAGQCRDVARFLGRTPWVTGALAGIEFVRCTSKLIDPSSSSFDRADAVFGGVSALANLGEAGVQIGIQMGAIGSAQAAPGMFSAFAPTSAAATVGTVCAVGAVVIPGTWILTKVLLRELGEMRIVGTAGLMADTFEGLPGIAEEAKRKFDRVTIAQIRGGLESDPERQDAYQRVARTSARETSASLKATRIEAPGWPGRVIGREIEESLRTPGASGTCDDPSLVAAALTALNERITWCLENAALLVADESGVRDEAALRALYEQARVSQGRPPQEPSADASPLRQNPTE